MEDGRHERRKQNDPDFVASAASGVPCSNPNKAGKDGERADEEIFAAALERRRKQTENEEQYSQ